MPTVDHEGSLRIGLALGGGRVRRVRIDSTRPDVARGLLQGRSPSEIRAALPRLFAICGSSQAAAGELACAVAGGEPATDDALARCRAAVSAEVVRETAWRVLLEWPRWIGEPPGADAVATARALAARPRAIADADAVVDANAGAGADADAIARAVFGVGADAWLAGGTAALDRWIDAGATAAARVLRRVRDDDAQTGGDAARRDASIPLLDGSDRSAAMVELWSACEADSEFVRRPTRHGRPAETGALARLQSDPLVAALARRPASRVLARFAARLVELARLLAGRDAAAVGVQSLAPGAAAAWVENARGLLVHHVRLDGARAATYRIVAPTEWNFHPDGAMAVALVGAPATDRAALRQRAERIARSLDPCVACRVEIDDA